MWHKRWSGIAEFIIDLVRFCCQWRIVIPVIRVIPVFVPTLGVQIKGEGFAHTRKKDLGS